MSLAEQDLLEKWRSLPVDKQQQVVSVQVTFNLTFMLSVFTSRNCQET
jgi:hypothetical protein